jgi:hypothetical protein
MGPTRAARAVWARRLSDTRATRRCTADAPLIQQERSLMYEDPLASIEESTTLYIKWRYTTNKKENKLEQDVLVKSVLALSKFTITFTFHCNYKKAFEINVILGWYIL